MSISQKRIRFLITKKVEERVDNKFTVYARYEFAGFSEDGTAIWIPFYSAHHKDHCFSNMKEVLVALNIIKIMGEKSENLNILKYSEAEILQLDRDVTFRENVTRMLA